MQRRAGTTLSVRSAATTISPWGQVAIWSMAVPATTSYAADLEATRSTAAGATTRLPGRIHPITSLAVRETTKSPLAPAMTLPPAVPAGIGFMGRAGTTTWTVGQTAI